MYLSDSEASRDPWNYRQPNSPDVSFYQQNELYNQIQKKEDLHKIKEDLQKLIIEKLKRENQQYSNDNDRLTAINKQQKHQINNLLATNSKLKDELDEIYQHIYIKQNINNAVMTEQNEFQDQDLNQTQNKTNVEQKIDHEDSEDDLSISTDEILHTAMYHQHYQSTENQRLENEVSLLREHIKVYVYEQIHNSNFDNNQVGQLDTESVQSVEHKCYADDLENDMETESKISDNDSSSGDSDMLERIMMRNLSLFESKSNENNNSDNQSSCNDSSVANNGNNIIPMANPYNTYDHGCNTENILPSFVQFIPHEYAKVDTMFSNIGDVYYHNNVLPEIMQQSEMLMQLLQDQQIFMKIFTDAWNCYFVICVYSISNSAFKNFYLLLYGSKCLCQFRSKNDLFKTSEY